MIMAQIGVAADVDRRDAAVVAIQRGQPGIRADVEMALAVEPVEIGVAGAGQRHEPGQPADIQAGQVVVIAIDAGQVGIVVQVEAGDATELALQALKPGEEPDALKGRDIAVVADIDGWHTRPCTARAWTARSCHCD